MPAIEVTLTIRPDFNNPSVVDEYVYLAVVCGDFASEPVDLGCVGEIANRRVDFITLCG